MRKSPPTKTLHAGSWLDYVLGKLEDCVAAYPRVFNFDQCFILAVGLGMNSVQSSKALLKFSRYHRRHGRNKANVIEKGFVRLTCDGLALTDKGQRQFVDLLEFALS